MTKHKEEQAGKKTYMPSVKPSADEALAALNEVICHVRLYIEATDALEMAEHADDLKSLRAVRAAKRRTLDHICTVTLPIDQADANILGFAAHRAVIKLRELRALCKLYLTSLDQMKGDDYNPDIAQATSDAESAIREMVMTTRKTDN